MKDVSIVYVNKFKMERGKTKKKFGGKPIEGKLYRVVLIEGNYVLHIGKEETGTSWAGVLLGPELQGNYGGGFTYELIPVTLENIINFDLDHEELSKFKTWTDTNNADIPDPDNELEEEEGYRKQPKELEKALDSNQKNVIELAKAQNYFGEVMTEVGESLNTFIMKDKYFSLVLGETLNYMAKTYGDKYEASGINYAKEYLLRSPNPDAAIFNAMKYIQRYATTGFDKSRNIKDIQKAIHYLLFELQRSFIQNQTNEQKNFPNPS